MATIFSLHHTWTLPACFPCAQCLQWQLPRLFWVSAIRRHALAGVTSAQPESVNSFFQPGRIRFSLARSLTRSQVILNRGPLAVLGREVDQPELDDGDGLPQLGACSELRPTRASAHRPRNVPRSVGRNRYYFARNLIMFGGFLIVQAEHT